MNSPDKSQVISGRIGRLLNSPAFSAAWGQVLALALLGLSAVPSYAASQEVLDGTLTPIVTNKLSADLQPRAGANEMVDVIIQYRQMPGSSNLKTMQDGGAALKSTLQTIRAVAMRVPASMLAVLAKDPNVVYITPDPVSYTHLDVYKRQFCRSLCCRSSAC